MLEPLAASVLNSILPSRPLAAHILSSKSAFGMSVRSANHVLPHDFFTPHMSGVKGKGRALPEHEHGACSSNSSEDVLHSKTDLFESEVASVPAPKALPTRQRTRRISAHKAFAPGVDSHIPSLRMWMRQVHQVQRRHASSRPAVVEMPRHPTPPPDQWHVWRKTFKDVSLGRSSVSPEHAWQAFEALWQPQGRPPGPPSAALAFLANLTLAVLQGQEGNLSQDVLLHWGKRLQTALHHIDPGVQDMPSNLVRVRWNGLVLASLAMLGRLEEAMEGCAMLFHQVDERHKNAQRGQMLQVYTVLVLSVYHYRGARAVLDLLTEHAWVNKYLTGSPHNPVMVPEVNRFAKVSRSVLSGITDPVSCLQDSLAVWSKARLSMMGSLLVRVASSAKRNAYPIIRLLQRESIPVPDEIVFQVVKHLARAGSFDLAAQLLLSLSPQIARSQGGSRPRPDYHSTALFLASRSGDVAMADKHYKFLSQHLRADLDDKATYMHAYAVSGKPARVAELFDELFPTGPDHPSKQQRPNIVHYTTVIFAHAQVGDLDGVNVWLGKLSRAGLRPDLHVYSIILQSFASRGDIESMSTLLDQIRQNNVTLNAVTYTTLISTLAERQDPIAAERIYKRAIDEGVIPDRAMITAIMNAHVEAGSWHGAIRAFDYLNTPERPGAALTIEVFNTLMKAYVLIGAPFRIVANLFRQLGAAKLRPDVRTFALLIQSACDSGFMDIAEDLYKEMERLHTQESQTSLRTNVYILTIMMRGYLHLGRRLKAKGVLDRMKELGVQPNAITYASIMKAYSEQTTEGGTKVAEDLLKSLMTGSESKPWLQLERGRRIALETVFRPLLNAYAKKEMVDEVERVHREMMDAGTAPSLGSLTALLDVYRRTGNIQAVREVWPEIHRLGLEYTRQNSFLSAGQSGAPSLSGLGIVMCIPLSIYIDALSAAGEHPEVAHVWKALKDQGLLFDSHNWNHLVTALVRAGETHRAFDIVENVILKYQAQARQQQGRERDVHPSTPLTLDLPPPEEGDLPPTRPEAPLHNAPRRAEIVERSTKRLRNVSGLEERGAQDFAHPLHMLHQMSPVWNTWRPHGATLTLLGRVLDHLRSGNLIQPVRPNADVAFEQAALDVEELRRRTEAAGIILGGIYDAFPRTVQLVREYEIMKRSSQRGRPEDRS
ncbi:hypothetical protein BD414DRAFT_472820 [Trametes punicea]|nr:hypothetical protein BD414DRAFT_472820 [Trametes punicea]